MGTLGLGAKLFWLAIAGGLGTVARYGVAMALDRGTQTGFPWGTFAVNMFGCLLFGLVYAALEQRLNWPGDVRGIVLTGFMGAFTTYSTFAFNSATLIRDTQYTLAAINIVSQNVLGVLLILAGLAIGKNL